MKWTLTEEDQKLLEIANKALLEERQQIETGNGVVVVISREELERIEGKKLSLGEYLLRIPKVDEADFSRDKSMPRDYEW